MRHHRKGYSEAKIDFYKALVDLGVAILEFHLGLPKGSLGRCKDGEERR